MPHTAAAPLAVGCVVPAALPRGSQGPADHAALKASTGIGATSVDIAKQQDLS